MSTMKNAKDEVIKKLTQYNADHPGPFPEYPQIKRVDWNANNDVRNIDNIKAIQEVSRMKDFEGYKDAILVTVHGELKRKDPQEDIQLNKAYEELKEMMKPLRVQDDDDFPVAPWKTKRFIVYLKCPNRR